MVCTGSMVMPDADNDLRELVRKYRVTWQTHPEMGPSGKSVAPIGYVVELNAIPDDPKQVDAIACPACDQVEDALDRLTQVIGSGEVVHVGRGTRELGTSHDTHPEVSATVTVLHHDGKGDNRPVDQTEQDRLAAIVERLRTLGAQERHWRDAT